MFARNENAIQLMGGIFVFISPTLGFSNRQMSSQLASVQDFFVFLVDHGLTNKLLC